MPGKPVTSQEGPDVLRVNINNTIASTAILAAAADAKTQRRDDLAAAGLCSSFQMDSGA
jgi:hypothetical protein